MITPSYVVQKTVQRMDPMTAYEPPSGGLYSAARFVRDMPFSHPVATGAMAFALGPLSAIPMAQLWATSAAYSTLREALSAAPTIGRTLARIGRGTPEFTAPMLDTTAAANMRQASLRAIHDSGYFLRSVLGREARLAHY